MVIIRIQGGLGNQMFQYALYRKYQYMSIKAKVDISWYHKKNVGTQRKLELKIFPVKLIECSKCERIIRDNIFTRFLNKYFGICCGVYVEPSSCVFIPEILKKRSGLLEGYWQTEKYFKDIREELLEEFTFPPSLTDEEENVLQSIRRYNSVSIHIRRGDYLSNADKYGNICTKEFYFKAIQFLQEKLNTPLFYVFSDDMKWAKKEFSTFQNMFFVELGDEISDIHDMKLMSSCKHNIIANSSFSWWASWLNQNPDKMIIAPKCWQNRNECPDIACENWIVL